MQQLSHKPLWSYVYGVGEGQARGVPWVLLLWCMPNGILDQLHAGSASSSLRAPGTGRVGHMGSQLTARLRTSADGVLLA